MMKTGKNNLAFTLFLLTPFLLVLSTSHAGDLEPSAPPGSTMKTLDEVEPRIPISSLPITISTSGSYYVTGNLTSSGHGILVYADDVSIDLMGHTISGPDSTASYYGVYASDRDNISVANGVIKDFYNGVNIIGTSLSQNCSISKVKSVSNYVNGIYVVSDATLVQDCVASENGAKGIYCSGQATVVSECTAYQNTTDGIYVGSTSIVENCTSYDNTEEGIVLSNSGSKAIHCTARSNNGDGIQTSSACFVSDCSASSNTLDGIQIGLSSVVRNCQASYNDQYGIRTTDKCTVVGNTVGDNDHWGIYAEDGCRITDNHVSSNNADNIASEGGIYANIGCLVKNNMCYDNNKYNIAVYYGNLIDSNLVSNDTSSPKSSDKGIYMEDVGNYCQNNRVYNTSSPFDGIEYSNSYNYYNGSNYEFEYSMP